MIPEIQDIEEFYLINHFNKNQTPIKSTDTIKLVGIPCDYYGEHQPFVEAWENGKLTATFNCADISIITFKDEP